MTRTRSLRLQLDFRSGLPAYLQIVRHVQRQAASGALRPGDRLPPVRVLADELGLNFNTAARAYRLLGDTGLVSTQRGRGTYILRKAPRPAAARSAGATRPALAALADEYVLRAKRSKFTDAEIGRMVLQRLKQLRSSEEH